MTSIGQNNFMNKGAIGNSVCLNNGSLSENNLMHVLQEGINRNVVSDEDFDKTLSTIDNQMSEQCQDNNIIYVNECNYTPSLLAKKKNIVGSHLYKPSSTD